MSVNRSTVQSDPQLGHREEGSKAGLCHQGRLLGGEGTGQSCWGRQRKAGGRGYSGGRGLAQPQAGSNRVSAGTGAWWGTTDAGVYTPETDVKLRLTALSLSGKQRFKFTKTRRGKGSE